MTELLTLALSQSVSLILTLLPGGGHHCPGRAASSWGAPVEQSREEVSRQRTEDAHEAEKLLEEHAAWIDQSIVCLYFQNQQQSYMVNRHNAQNPSSPIVIDKAGQWVENPPTPEDVSDEEADPHDNLSAYELERRERIERHDAELRRLDLPELGNRY